MAEEEQQDFSKLPLDDRCTHKNWKARVSAYEELTKIFQNIDDEKAPEWSKYGSWVRKFPTDSNAAAQEKAMELTLLYLENAGQAGKIVAEVMNGIVNKGITATKARSKELSTIISLMCVEIEKYEVVQEELMKGMEHKNPKVVGGCICILTEILKAFGPKVINLKTILKKIPILIEDRDKYVREETKKIMVELYRWIGPAFKPQLSAVKELVVKEVEAEVEKCTEKPRQTRYLRSQQVRLERAAVEAEGDDEADGEVPEEVSPDIDPYDLLDPVDILAKLPKDFYEKCEAKKWQDRKEAVEALEALITANPKLEPGDYSDLVRCLKRLIGKDINVLVVALAGKCVAGLATGLKKKFSPYSPSCISTILEKFKEKKTNVVSAMKEAIDACFLSTSLEAIQEDVVQALQNKNPQVKMETNLFLSRVFAKTSLKFMSDKKVMKPYFTAIVANLNESDPNVRDAAAEALGVAMKHLGEKTLNVFTTDLEPMKLQKVKEFCEKAVITAPKEKSVKPAPKPAAVKATVKPSVISKSAPSAGAKKLAPKKAVLKKNDDELSNLYGGSEEDLASPSSPVNGEEEGVTRVDISGYITETILNELVDKNWKTRDEALDKISALIAKYKCIKPSLGDLIPALSLRLQDSNKNLSTNTFLLCQNLAAALGPNCKRHTASLAANMLAGLSDSKIAVRSTVIACINAWADNGGIHEFFQSEIIADALKNGNPFLKSELFSWLGARLNTMKTVNKEELNACIPALYAAIEDRNVDVRKSAQDVVLSFMIHLGYEGMSRQATKLKPSSKTVIDAFLAKTKPNLPAKPAPPPATTSNKSVRGGGGKSVSSAKPGNAPSAYEAKTTGSKIGRVAPSKTRASPPSKKAAEEIIGANLPENNLKSQRISDEMKLKILRWNFSLPRDEFIDLLKDLMTSAGFGRTLMTNMFHTDFKMHLKALDILQEEFNQGFEGTIANLDLILKWSTLRFFDTNPSVLIRILDYLGQVFQVVGDQDYSLADVEASAFIPYLLLKIGDPKDTVRASVHNILQLLTRAYSPQRIFSNVMDGLKSKNARQRAECLDELANMISLSGLSVIHPSPSVALKEIAKQIADRDNSVRNSALNAIVQAYYIVDDKDKLYRLIGQLTDKDQSLLEERIKRAAKNKTEMAVPNQACLTSRVMPMVPPSSLSIMDPNSAPPTTVSPNRFNLPIGNATILNNPNLNTTIEVPEVPLIRNRTQTYFNADAPRVPTVPDKYRINFEAIDQLYYDPTPLPPLELLNTDIDEFVLDQNITLPRRGTGHSPRNPENLMVPSQANQSIDLVVTHIGDTSIRTSTEACLKLESMVKDTETSAIMSGRVDSMLAMVALQLRRQQPTLMTANQDKFVDLNKFFRAAVSLLTAVFKGDFLPKRACKESLREIIYHLLVLIIDENLGNLSDATQIIKMINVMVVRIIEKADPNEISCALIRLLNETLTVSPAGQTRLLDLVMKCQWKLLKQYNIWVENKDYNWDVFAILSEFNVFMRAHPFSSFQGRDVTPLKTIKTILHALVIHVGSEPLQYQLNGMSELRDSEAGLYLSKLIQREQAKKRGVPTASSLDLTSGSSTYRLTDNFSAMALGCENNKSTPSQNNNAMNSEMEFMNTLPDPEHAPTAEARAACYLQRLKMIQSRGGVHIPPTKPSINLGMDMSDGEESTI